MRKLLYTFLAVSIIFASCKKEEENNPSSSPASIIGSWTINTVDLTSDTSSYTFTPNEISLPSGLEFVSGGILYEDWGGSSDTNEWTIVVDSLYIGEDGEDLRAKHQVTATKLTLTAPMEENMFFATTMIINATRNLFTTQNTRQRKGTTRNT